MPRRNKKMRSKKYSNRGRKEAVQKLSQGKNQENQRTTNWAKV